MRAKFCDLEYCKQLPKRANTRGLGVGRDAAQLFLNYCFLKKTTRGV